MEAQERHSHRRHFLVELRQPSALSWLNTVLTSNCVGATVLYARQESVESGKDFLHRQERYVNRLILVGEWRGGKVGGGGVVGVREGRVVGRRTGG